MFKSIFIITMLFAWLSKPISPSPEYCLPVNIDKCTREVGKYGLTKRHPMLYPPNVNKGLNFTLPSGSEVYSISSGKVSKSLADGGFGNHIIIKVNDSTQATYAHLADMEVNEGDSVKCGELIGHVGNTGRSTAPHLHLRVSVNDEYIDPKLFLDIPAISSLKK